MIGAGVGVFIIVLTILIIIMNQPNAWFMDNVCRGTYLESSNKETIAECYSYCEALVFGLYMNDDNCCTYNSEFKDCVIVSKMTQFVVEGEKQFTN